MNDEGRCDEFGEMISRRMDGDLSLEEIQLLEDHLGTCQPCRRLAVEMRATVLPLKALASMSVPAAYLEQQIQAMELEEYPEHPFVLVDKPAAARQSRGRTGAKPSLWRRITYQPAWASAAAFCLFTGAVVLSHSILTRQPSGSAVQRASLLSNATDSFEVSLRLLVGSDSAERAQQPGAVLNADQRRRFEVLVSHQVHLAVTRISDDGRVDHIFNSDTEQGMSQPVSTAKHSFQIDNSHASTTQEAINIWVAAADRPLTVADPELCDRFPCLCIHDGTCSVLPTNLQRGTTLAVPEPGLRSRGESGSMVLMRFPLVLAK